MCESGYRCWSRKIPASPWRQVFYVVVSIPDNIVVFVEQGEREKYLPE